MAAEQTRTAAYVELVAARAEYHKAVLDDLREHAALVYPNPPAPVAVTDLWAHLRHIRDDGTEAARMVKRILDLGWRPQPEPAKPEPLINPDDYETDLIAEAMRP